MMTQTQTLPALLRSKETGVRYIDCPVIENSGKGLAVVYHPKAESYMILHISSKTSVAYAPQKEAIEFMKKLLQEFDDWENTQWTWIDANKIARLEALRYEFYGSLPMEDDAEAFCDDDECDDNGCDEEADDEF